MQLEFLECGAACLAMILAYYGKWIPLEQVRLDCGVSRDGSSAKNVVIAARNYGLEAAGYRFEPEALKEKGMFPCIIHWNFNHFVVLCGFKGNRVYLNDPAKGNYSVSMKTFDESFTGVALMFEPGENFVPSGHKKSVLSFAASRLKGTGPAVAFTVLTGVITSLMNVISPGFSRVFLDRLLPGENPTWVGPFFAFLITFNIVVIAVNAIQAIYSLKIDGKMSVVGSTSYLWKVLNMPMQFFSQRMAGDIQGRQGVNAGIAGSLVNTFAPLALKTVMMVFYFLVMINYSWVLTLVGLSSMALNAIVSNYISRKRINITRVSMRDAAKLESTTVAGIEMIETIKAGGAENGFFARWSGYQASVNTQNIRFSRLNSYLGIIPQFVSTLADNVVLILGVFLTMKGEFTVGMIMAFQGFMASFISPATMLISSGQTLQEMRTSMERINDVMEYPEDDIFAPETPQPETSQADNQQADNPQTEETIATQTQNDDICYEKLSGNLEIKDVSFGYATLGEPIVKNFNLKLESGKSIAIVGGSGCGKSTMAKLISGLYKPWSGEILFDGKKHSQINKDVFYGSLAVVDQDIILFEDTIANNIKMWDESIEDFEMIMAAKDAQIHYDIMQRPGGYNYKLSEGGKDMSGGERQRLEIARVLAQDPTIIILDEATSALDAKTEYEVVKAIRDRGIACIVVAHRLSTIRSCDEIIVMKKGEICARGTHKSLMETSEEYRELVSNE